MTSTESTVKASKKDKVLITTEIISFSRLIADLLPAHVSSSLNSYLEIVCDAIGNAGGEYEFHGDIVFGYFEPSQSDAAIEAAFIIHTELKEARKKAQKESPMRTIYPAIVITRGDLIESQVGIKGKYQREYVGGARGIAGKLRRYIPRLNTQFLVTAPVLESSEMDWNARKVIQYKGRAMSDYLDIFTIDYGVTSRVKDGEMINAEIDRYITANASMMQSSSS